MILAAFIKPAYAFIKPAYIGWLRLRIWHLTVQRRALQKLRDMIVSDRKD